MVACMIALNALAIDIMLPALGEIGEHFKLQEENDQQKHDVNHRRHVQFDVFIFRSF